MKPRAFRLWIPIFLVWLVLLPAALVLVPLTFLVCLICGMNPFRALSVFGQILTAVKGTHVEIEHNHYSVMVRIA